MVVEMKCHKCGYKWFTKSERMFVSCPNCLSKVKRNEKDIGVKADE